MKLLSVAVLPSAGSVSLGGTQQFQAIGSYNNNATKDLTTSVLWSSSATAVATISNSAGTKGLLSPLTVGATTISAKQGTGSTAVTGLTTATVVPMLTSIAVTPTTPTVVAGTPQPFTATGNYNDGTQRNLTASVLWSSSNPAVASIGASGLAATATAGQTTISATLGLVTGSALLTVQPAALTSISVTTLGPIYVGVGSNSQLMALGSFSDGSTKDMTHAVLWASNNPAVATVDGYGLATSTGAGAATISATAGTVSGSAVLNGIAGGFVSCDARILDMNVLVVTNGKTEPANTGIPNPFQPSILMLPRHPNNLFFNVSTPDEWQAEYGCIYPQLAYSYPQILDNISDTFVANMLKGDIDPEMFHQPNLRAYDGTHSILGDLIDATNTKYGNLVNFPILSLTEDTIGAKMANRAQYNTAGVTASFIAHQRIMITATQAATVPVTGLPSATAETYGGETISHVDVAAGQTVTLPLP